METTLITDHCTKKSVDFLFKNNSRVELKICPEIISHTMGQSVMNYYCLIIVTLISSYILELVINFVF